MSTGLSTTDNNLNALSTALAPLVAVTAKANTVGATSYGTGASATGQGATAVGMGASASGTDATALGKNANASGSAATALGANSVASAPNSVALGAGSVANEANTVSIGSVGNERRLTNVAEGVNGTDAANMNQIWRVQSSVNQVARDAYSGVAAATALTMIPDVDVGKTIAVGIGAATYHGYAASALGVTARITQNLKMKAGVGLTSAGVAAGAGVSYQW
nr:YadA-like family protein [Burkholderia sp. Ac-20345]